MASTKNTSSFDPSEKRLSFVYNSDISGFQPLDFGKLNNVEDILINFSGFGINVHQDDLNPITDSVSVSGRLYEVISGFDTFGINVHQDDLTASTDSVSVSGRLYEVISGFDTFGINVHQDDLTASTDSVSVSGRLYEVISGFDTFGINVHQDDLTASTDFVTAVPERNSIISNHTQSGTNGTALQANSNRKELFVQNLQSGNLYVKYGTSAACNSFNFVLASSTASGGGDGGSLSDLNYTGVVSVSGLDPSYICWERS